jgi:hypothetical protein
MGKRLLAYFLLGILLGPLAAADSADGPSNALRDAQKLADCMAAMDGKCTVDHMYVPFFEKNGLSRAEAAEKMVEMYDRAKAAGMPSPKYQLTKPEHVMTGDDRQYVFVPYVVSVDEPDKSADKKSIRMRAFFIGISTDSGASWQFLDGISVNPDSMKTIMPSYAGQALPPVGPVPSGL